MCAFTRACVHQCVCMRLPSLRPYAAPELYKGNGGTYNLPLTDMWSCGALLHFLLTGACVNRGEDGVTTHALPPGHGCVWVWGRYRVCVCARPRMESVCKCDMCVCVCICRCVCVVCVGLFADA